MIVIIEIYPNTQQHWTNSQEPVRNDTDGIELSYENEQCNKINNHYTIPIRGGQSQQNRNNDTSRNAWQTNYFNRQQ
jgi:hypothetical protein